jgi:hypothetical protein
VENGPAATTTITGIMTLTIEFVVTLQRNLKESDKQ